MLLFIHTFSRHKNVQEYKAIILPFIVFNTIKYIVKKSSPKRKERSVYKNILMLNDTC